MVLGLPSETTKKTHTVRFTARNLAEAVNYTYTTAPLRGPVPQWGGLRLSQASAEGLGTALDFIPGTLKGDVWGLWANFYNLDIGKKECPRSFQQRSWFYPEVRSL